MIVRILTDNQYWLDEQHRATVTQLDNRLLEAVEQDDDVAFVHWLFQLVQLIQKNGRVVAPHQLVASEVIAPAPDMTLHEVKQCLRAPIFL